MDYWSNLRALLSHPKPVLSCYGQFIGEDGSLWLRKGQILALKVYREGGRLWAYWNGGRCPYDTMDALMRNWRLL